MTAICPSFEKTPRIQEPEAAMHYQLQPGVFHVSADGVTRLLDFDHGQFYGLDAIGTRMLDSVLAQGRDEAIRSIAQEYDASEEQVRHDLSGLIDDLQAKEVLDSVKHRKFRLGNSVRRVLFGLCALVASALSLPMRLPSRLGTQLQRFVGKEPPIPATAPSRRAVSRLLTQAWWSLRCFGWNGTLKRWFGNQPAAQVPAGLDAPQLIASVNSIIRHVAARRFLLPMACKERALAGYYLLRQHYGLPATLVVGMIPHPFSAHAWVECLGQIVTDDAAHCELFAPVARYS